ncbi:hypothetical protein [Proteus cibi]|uniref:hypothetical protein n=1 Tax=Proteus cibi TaxID=2050966 RepID=UPI0035A699A9
MTKVCEISANDRHSLAVAPALALNEIECKRATTPSAMVFIAGSSTSVTAVEST